MRRDKPWVCMMVPPRATTRVRIGSVIDWCVDFSVPSRPLLWIISEAGWYLVSLLMLLLLTLFGRCCCMLHANRLVTAMICAY